MPPRIDTGRGELKVSLPLPLLRAFKAAIHDPIRNRSKYAKAGQIVAGLLRTWLRDNHYPLSVVLDDQLTPNIDADTQTFLKSRYPVQKEPPP